MRSYCRSVFGTTVTPCAWGRRVPGRTRPSPRYEKRYSVTWLTPSPAVEPPCLAVTQYSAEQYWLLTLSECSAIAKRLRLEINRRRGLGLSPSDVAQDFVDANKGRAGGRRS